LAALPPRPPRVAGVGGVTCFQPLARASRSQEWENRVSSMASQLDQARRLHNQGRTDDARAVLLRVLQKSPADPTANQIMAVLLANAGKHDQAIYYADRALAARPDLAQFHLLKGTILSNTPRVLEAIPIIERATELEPGNARAWLALGALRQGARRHAQAEAAFRRGLEIEPENPDLVAPLAGMLLETGRPEEAVDLLRGALRTHPEHTLASEILAFCLNYDARATAREVFEAHRRFGALVEAGAAPQRCTQWPIQGAAGTGRRLRVGYVSADLRTHAVSTFFAPVVEHHDRERVELFLYHTSPVVDDTTRRLQKSAEHWFGSRTMKDDELFDRIRADRLDILVELSGLTAQHRLAVMARKPARVQATFIGYPNTTGLTAIDYLIVDAHTDPAGYEAYATESLARLPNCLLCYDPPSEAPTPAPPPCLAPRADGHAGTAPFTFASFNTLGKTTDFTLRLWARVLGAVASSRLLLKASGLTDPQVHEALLMRVTRAGIDPARLTLLGFTPKSGHLATYAMADVCLDPHPFNGATTTADALYMGVPVVTLEGDRHVARAGMSILRTIGRGEWVARTDDEYVRIAAQLAGDRASLARIRTELRGQVARSALCDAKGYTRALEEMYAGWVGET